mgnify:CR=1 FL=1
MPMNISRGGIVLLFSDQRHEAQREKVAGVYSASFHRGWQIVPITEYPSEDVIRREIKTWNPIGVIVDPISLRGPLSRSPFGSIPVVLMGVDDNRRRQIFDCTANDDLTPAQMAIKALSSRRFDAYAYFPHPSGQYWSRKRCEAFRSCVNAHAAKRIPFLIYSGSDPEQLEGQQALSDWIRSLPKPCGVFLATDQLATAFYVAAARAKVSIPNEVAVVGVDDLEFICQNLNPHLTSVDVDFSKAGEIAIELIERRINDPKADRETRYYPATGITRRGSTGDVIIDARVRKALAYIEEHFTESLSVADVVMEMGCCRRLAERVFTAATGKSILDKIRENRLERAYMLLRDQTIPVDDIPSLCGYESVGHFKNYFKRITGKTMRQWRNQVTVATVDLP